MGSRGPRRGSSVGILGLLYSLCFESQMAVLAGVLLPTLNPTLRVPLLFAKVFRQQLAENLGAWVWEVEREQLFHLPHQSERYFHLLKLRLFCSTHSWTKTGLLSGSFLFNDFHEKAFIQALT